MRPPGHLSELGAEGEQAWRQRVAAAFDALDAAEGEGSFVRQLDEGLEAAITATDWTGFPVRVADCLTRERALRLLDLQGRTVAGGGRSLQEEYAEWRVVRRGGVVSRVELTTELPDYWRVLAAHNPTQLLELVSEFSGEAAAETEVFGACDPFGRGVSPEEREQGFAQTMLGPSGRSPYNDGRLAICCMSQRSNDLRSLLALALAATSCRVIADAAGGHLRCLTCSESASFLGSAAQLGRASDPILVERLGRLAYEGRQVAFDDPLGVYIVGVEPTRLRTPSGEVTPREWFTFGRGVGADRAVDDRARYQRVALEVPAEEGFAVGQLIDVATERPVRHGGEIADLVALVVRLRVSEADVVEVDRETPVTIEETGGDPESCADVRSEERRLLEELGSAL